eukprot:1158048-Pelagomonas_calceolata.AAC.12
MANGCSWIISCTRKNFQTHRDAEECEHTSARGTPRSRSGCGRALHFLVTSGNALSLEHQYPDLSARVLLCSMRTGCSAFRLGTSICTKARAGDKAMLCKGGAGPGEGTAGQLK